MTAGRLVTDALGPAGIWRIVRIVVLVFAAAAVMRLLPFRPPEPGRPRWARQKILVPAGVTAIGLIAAGCGYGLTHRPDPMATARAIAGNTSATGVTNVAPARTDTAKPADAPKALTAPETTPAPETTKATQASRPLVGVFEPGATASYQLVSAFTAATGARPGIALYYSGWGDPFQIRFATWAHQAGTIPFAQLEPAGVQLAGVAGGRDDSYLRTFAAAVRAYGHPVILGFAPEMNGDWYSWGNGDTAPAVWVAAWRHVVDTFRQAGASNVTWLWTVNSVNAAAAPLSQWWPGAAYVDWVGIDGYYYTPADTFGSVFGTTISQIRALTTAPILISETAAGAGAGQAAQIRGLFAGVQAGQLAGLVWFDMAQHDGEFHQDWRLEDSPAGLAEFSRDAAQMEAGR